MKVFALAFLLLVASIAPAQFPDSPEKRVADPVGRFKYIKEYNRAIRTLATKKPCDQASAKEIERFTAAISFMAVWSDGEVEKRRAMFDNVLNDAKAVNGR